MTLTTLLRKQPDQAADPGGAGPKTARVGGHTWPDPAKPSALLVPAYVRENRTLAVIKRWAVVAVAVTVALVAVAVVASLMASSSSDDALAAAQAEQAAAQTQVDNLAPIAAYYDGLEVRRQATVNLLSVDVRHSDLFAAVRHALPAGVSLESYATAIGMPCAGPNPFEAPSNIGCLAISGEADSPASVARFLGNLKRGASADLISEAFVTNMTEGEKQGSVKFTANANFTKAAFSLKYVPDEDAAAMVDKAAATVLATQSGAVQ